MLILPFWSSAAFSPIQSRGVNGGGQSLPWVLLPALGFGCSACWGRSGCGAPSGEMWGSAEPPLSAAFAPPGSPSSAVGAQRNKGIKQTLETPRGRESGILRMSLSPCAHTGTMLRGPHVKLPIPTALGGLFSVVCVDVPCWEETRGRGVKITVKQHCFSPLSCTQTGQSGHLNTENYVSVCWSFSGFGSKLANSPGLSSTATAVWCCRSAGLGLCGTGR